MSGVLYVYAYDDDLSTAESDPTIIKPDDQDANGRWVLQTTYPMSLVTASAAELNILDGVTASAAELNLLDGSVAGTAVASKALCLGASKNVDTIDVTKDGLKIGGTPVTTTAAELNILDGVTTSTAELNHIVGVTSAIQTQLGTKAPLAAPTFTGMVALPVQTLTTSGGISSNIALLNRTTPTIAATLAVPVAGQYMIISQVDAGTVGHTVTLSTATWNGANKVATFNAAGETLYVIAISTTRFVILVNLGSVALSA